MELSINQQFFLFCKNKKRSTNETNTCHYLHYSIVWFFNITLLLLLLFHHLHCNSGMKARNMKNNDRRRRIAGKIDDKYKKGFDAREWGIYVDELFLFPFFSHFRSQLILFKTIFLFFFIDVILIAR